MEYFRPSYFVLENVRNLIFYQNSLIFKIICSFFIQLGYQIRAAVLQVGQHGLPQNRKRLFVIGAKCGLDLPSFPEPRHLFSNKQNDTSFKIDGKLYDPISKQAIYRMITVEDAIRDLLKLDRDYFEEIDREYQSDTKLSHYQRMLRSEMTGQVSEHFCKKLGALNEERIRNVPFEIGSDWRDLPNIRQVSSRPRRIIYFFHRAKLCDGKIIQKLKYTFKDQKNGNSKTGSLRGVCSCSERKECMGAKQENTLIPWCLAHTANKQNHWPGLYGRLAWRGFFPTIITNFDPISIQGKILHPEQHRILSVREAARAQGFPDHFKFCGKINEKYRQIGNAVPPLLSTHLAREFGKSLQKSQ